MNNYLPEVPQKEEQHPAINAYRSLGMMALLDIDYWEGASERSIEQYYRTLLSHMQSQTVMVAIGQDKKPIGYATWTASNDNQVTLTRQSAPFGDHLELQQQLEKHFPTDSVVLSQHERSAREEQVAW